MWWVSWSFSVVLVDSKDFGNRKNNPLSFVVAVAVAVVVVPMFVFVFQSPNSPKHPVVSQMELER